MRPFYHYTCEHGHTAIDGYIIPNPASALPLAWFTDLAHPHRQALGLTSQALTCDRTQYRCTESQNPPTSTPGSTVRGFWDAHLVEDLETTPGARPRHWYVSPFEVPVIYDPQQVAREVGA